MNFAGLPSELWISLWLTVRLAATSTLILLALTLPLAGWMQRSRSRAVPVARNGILTGAALSFAHTMGEFGVVLMLGGNIPGVTRVASIALFDQTQTLNYAVANSYALVLLATSFALLLLIAWLRQHTPTPPRPRPR